MLGRGTRIDEQTGKLVFTIYDNTGATRLLGEAFITKPTPPDSGGGGENPPPPPPPPPVWVEGFAPVVNNLGRFVATSSHGRLSMVPLEDYQRGLAQTLVAD